jgi:hypothetical protein
MCTIGSNKFSELLSFWTSSGIWPKKKLNNAKFYGPSSECNVMSELLRVVKKLQLNRINYREIDFMGCTYKFLFVVLSFFLI